MKITIHRKEQDDLSGETLLACHMRATDGNRSTRLFAVMRCRYGEIMIVAGGKFAREFLARELDQLRARFA